MLIELTERDAIRSYLRAVRREQLRARVLGGEDHYSAVAAPLDYMLSLLDRPQLRNRVSRVAIDLAALDEHGRELLTGVLARLGAVDRLRSQPAQA